ncbi:hypothetical protein VIGAN_09097100, partial [Vigna angularis var. angularis]
VFANEGETKLGLSISRVKKKEIGMELADHRRRQTPCSSTMILSGGDVMVDLLCWLQGREGEEDEVTIFWRRRRNG